MGKMRRAVESCVAVLLVAGIGACRKEAPPAAGDGGGGPGGTKIKLVLNWVPEPEFGGFYAARDGGVETLALAPVLITTPRTIPQEER